MKRLLSVGGFLLLLSAAALPGCGGGGSSGGGGDGGGTTVAGEHDEALISAAKGGTIHGTGVSATIPPGALAKDTTITIDVKDKSTYPDAGSIAVDVYDFGPNGTQFSKPVSMTIDLGGATPPKGKTPVIAYFDGKAWQPLAGSTLAGGKVTATTTHFTPFTIVWSNGVQTGGGCGPLEFTPCGGDLVGTWTFSAACVDLGPASSDPTGGKCPQATTTATIDFTGSVTFTAGGMFNEMDTTSLDIVYDLPASCVSQLGGSCSNVGGTDDGMGGCDVEQMQAPKSSSSSGTYTTSGTQFTTTNTGSTTGTTLDYCVTGTTLEARELDQNGNTIIYHATKQ
ncbi:MAG TPA: hypothetical protein VHB21_13595 [Minicystis sp.]|nr:hypothetical protein [Minicystis sp.]